MDASHTCIPNEQFSRTTSSKDTHWTTALRRAAVQEGAVSPSVGLCSGGQYQRLVSIPNR